MIPHWMQNVVLKTIVSSNINEVIKEVSNFLFYFLEEDLERTKSTKKHQKAPKA